jgi:alpha-glucosidase
MRSLLRTLAVACFCAPSFFASPLSAQAPASAKPASTAVSTAIQLLQVTSVRKLPDGLEITSGKAVMRITAVRDDVLRVRISRDGTFGSDDSWAVVPATEESKVTVHPIGGSGVAGFSTAALVVRVEKSPLRLVIEDKDGQVLSEDAPGSPATFTNTAFRVTKKSPVDEHYYGLGDKPGPLDRRGTAWSMWNTDAYAWQESSNELYKDIPFFLALRRGVSYGIFLDNTWRSSFDFDLSDKSAISFGAENGPLDYYFIYGPSPKQVIANYTQLTGHTPLPPMWTLGFQQSRYTYMPESRLLEVAKTFRDKQIPLDAIWLDIGFQEKNRPFTVDTAKFPTFTDMVAQLTQEKVHTIAITDLHIAKVLDAGYAPYNSGMAADAFVKNPDGSVFSGVVWPGPAVFPDFTREAACQWWGGLYKDFYVDRGVSGFWNDMNEPSVFNGPLKTMPLDVQHRIDRTGHPSRVATHAEIHNIYGMQNSRCTEEGLLALKPDQRPFVMTRATYAGGQRYAATWTGDNSSTWNHMRISVPQLLSMGVSGYTMVGDDIGGYKGTPQPDLLTKWLELGAFNPIDRDHTEEGSADQEPWANGPEHEAIAKRYIETRYRLMPYLYTAAEEASRTGDPIMRPLFLEFPRGVETVGDEFLFGAALLVAPQPYETLDEYEVTFPAGSEWFDYWTGKRIEFEKPDPNGGPNVVPTVNHGLRIKPQLDTLPVFARAGSIIPQQPLVQSTGETPQGALELRVYPPASSGTDCAGSLYLDDGKTFAYRKGAFLRESYSCQTSATSTTVKIAAHEGSYSPWWQQAEVVIYGATHAARSVEVNGAAVEDARYDAASGTVRVTIPDVATGTEVRVAW